MRDVALAAVRLDSLMGAETNGIRRDIWRGLAVLSSITSLGLAILYFVKPPPLPPLPPVGVVALGMPADPQAALSTALDRLNQAVVSIPNHTIEQTLRRASAHGQGCMLVWNGGLPSIVFGRPPIPPNSIARTLSSCAEAVSRLH